MERCFLKKTSVSELRQRFFFFKQIFVFLREITSHFVFFQVSFSCCGKEAPFLNGKHISSFVFATFTYILWKRFSLFFFHKYYLSQGFARFNILSILPKKDARQKKQVCKSFSPVKWYRKIKLKGLPVVFRTQKVQRACGGKKKATAL